MRCVAFLFCFLFIQNISASAPVALCQDRSGNKVAIWLAQDASGAYVKASVFFNQQWNRPQCISSSSHAPSTFPSAAMNAYGQVVVLWDSCDSKTNQHFLECAKYIIGGAWVSEIILEHEDETPIRDYQLLLDDAGSISVVWRSFNEGSCQITTLCGSFEKWEKPQSFIEH